MLEDQEVQPERERILVCVYSPEEKFGGPEEGGWWYEVLTRYYTYVCEDENSALHLKLALSTFYACDSTKAFDGYAVGIVRLTGDAQPKWSVSNGCNHEEGRETLTDVELIEKQVYHRTYYC